MSQSDQCMRCQRYFGAHTCEAFPNRIPDEIMTGEHDHKEAYENDNGLRFVLADEFKEIDRDAE